MKNLINKNIGNKFNNSFILLLNFSIKNKIIENSFLSILDKRLFLVLYLVITYECNINGNNNKNEYLKYLFSDKGWNYLLNKYKCLNFVIQNEIDQTLKFVKDFYFRLEKDLNEIQEIFFSNTSDLITIDNITSIIIELSDRHNDSSTVLIIEFLNKFKIVYKPRNLKIDTTINILMGILNRYLGEETFLNFNTLEKDDYGWQEFIYEKECKNKLDINKYYKRQGINLALIYLLGGNDYHNENIIAYKDFPVLIDLETIIQPSTISKKPGNKDIDKFLNNAYYHVSNGLFRTGMLSSYNNAGIDMSAFGADLQKKSKKIDNISCLPILKGERINIIGYINEVKKGFIKYYPILQKILIKKYDVLFGGKENIQIRYINKPSQYYTDIISASLHPKYLINIDDRLNLIYKLLKEDSNSKAEKFVKHEVIQIWKLNIPKFTTNLQSKSLFIGNESIKNIFKESPNEFIIQNLNKKRNLINDGEIILNSYKTSLYNSGKQNKYIGKRCKKTNTIKNIDIKKAILKESKKIFNHLSDEAFIEGKYMIFSNTLSDKKKLSYGLVKGDLYSGMVGISLFFASYYKITGNKKSLHYVKKAFYTGRTLLLESNDDSLFSGKFGEIYGGLIVGKLIKDDNYINQSLNDFYNYIKLPRQNKDIDIIGGISGKLLVALNLYSIKNDIRINKYISKCIDIILGNYNKYGLKNLNSPKSFKLTGFAHGLSGIIYSLVQYSNLFKEDTKIIKYINQLRKYEDSFYSSNKLNWKDTRNKGSYEQYSWCYGSPGILLSHNNSSDNINSFLKKPDLFFNINGPDGLCHGNMGNLDVLLGLGKLKVHYLKNVINNKGWNTGLPNNAYDISLMNGEAGIGYMLLRILNSSEIPSILSIKI